MCEPKPSRIVSRSWDLNVEPYAAMHEPINARFSAYGVVEALGTGSCSPISVRGRRSTYVPVRRRHAGWKGEPKTLGIINRTWGLNVEPCAAPRVDGHTAQSPLSGVVDGHAERRDAGLGQGISGLECRRVRVGTANVRCGRAVDLCVYVCACLRSFVWDVNFLLWMRYPGTSACHITVPGVLN